VKNSPSDSSLTVGTPTEGILNHGYSNDSIFNQSATTDLTSAPVPLAGTDSTPSASSTTTVSSTSPIPKPSILENFKHMCSVIGELLKNTRYICIIIANLFEGILIKGKSWILSYVFIVKNKFCSGFVPFISKYFQYQHQLDTSTATLVTGAIALLSVILGCPVGAYCMNRFSWTPMRCARVCGIVFTASAFFFLFLTLSCPELKFDYSSCSTANSLCCHNIYHPGKNTTMLIYLTIKKILFEYFYLVCTVNLPHRMFLSPCHYGCINQTTSANDSATYYSSCNCADDPTVQLTEAACRFRKIPCKRIFKLRYFV
jgi:hypothetical protein